MKYIALLRGINISGKNKISMSELKKELQDNKYQNVITYLNSGNVIFECNTDNKEIIMKDFYKIIKNAFLALKNDSILYILDQKKIIFLAKFKIL